MILSYTPIVLATAQVNNITIFLLICMYINNNGVQEKNGYIHVL